MTHDHDWKPIPEMFRRYSCTCGVTGYRNSAGVIVEHKKPIEQPGPAVTARTTAHGPWLVERTRKDYEG